MQPFVTSRRFQISVFDGRADCGRDSSAPFVGRRGAGAFTSSLICMRERSARTALVTTGHLTKAPACRVTGTRASRRSTAAILGPITVLLSPDRGAYPHVIQAALALPFIRCCPSH